MSTDHPTDPRDGDSSRPPTIAEIAALTGRLRYLSSADATEAERAAFLADKDALLARIPADAEPIDRIEAGERRADKLRSAAVEAAVMEQTVAARAAVGGYAMVGPSARTWSVDPTTGLPTGPVHEAEHRAVRSLIAQERLDGAEPVWMRRADGSEEIVAAVVPGPAADVDYDEIDHTDVDGGQEPVGESRWWSEAADPERIASYPESIGEGWDRDADEYGTDVADELFDAENPYLEPPEEEFEAWDAGAWPEMPPEMLDGIEQRRTEPAQRDDSADVEVRLDVLRAEVATAVGTPEGGWQTVGREEAAHDLADRGTDLATARAMVDDYLRETSERADVPADAWGLDQGDLDAVAAGHRLPTALPPVVASAHATAEHDAAEAARADQLSRWYADDSVAEQAAGDDRSPDGLTDEAGWSR